jgi:phospholipase C
LRRLRRHDAARDGYPGRARKIKEAPDAPHSRAWRRLSRALQVLIPEMSFLLALDRVSHILVIYLENRSFDKAPAAPPLDLTAL